MKTLEQQGVQTVKFNIPIIETENPYLGWDPILGTRQNVRIVKPRFTFVGVDLGRGAEECVAEFQVYKKKRGRRKLRLRHMFTRSIGYK